jgi:hypothetical protein
MQAWLNSIYILTETQHNTALLLIQLVESHEAPDGQGYNDKKTNNPRREPWDTAATGGRTSATATASEYSPKLLLEFFQRFVEIRRPLIVTTPRILGIIITATRFIPGHSQLLIKKEKQSIKLFTQGTQNCKTPAN